MCTDNRTKCFMLIHFNVDFLILLGNWMGEESDKVSKLQYVMYVLRRLKFCKSIY